MSDTSALPNDKPRRLSWGDPALAEIPLPDRALHLTQSLSSGLTVRKLDDAGVFWGVGDRGPNIKPADAVARYGPDKLKTLSDIDGAKVMPLPQSGPALARFRIVGERIVLEEAKPLRAADGTLLNGVPPARLDGAECEPAFELSGEPLPPSNFGADTEAIAALPDGRFWIADEYGPSLLLAGEDGVIERRLVPEGSSAMFAGSPVPLDEVLPGLALERKLNRGFEALVLSADGRTLFVAFQSPLAHPDRDAHEAGDLVRMWALDPASGTLLDEYAYPLDPPEAFLRDQAEGSISRSDVKLGELAALDDGSLLVLERVTLSSHVYRITPVAADALLPAWRDPARRPTLEQAGQAGATEAGIRLLKKGLVLSTDAHSEICGNIEGMIAIGSNLLLASDSDYGIDGAATEFWLVPLPATASGGL